MKWVNAGLAVFIGVFLGNRVATLLNAAEQKELSKRLSLSQPLKVTPP